MVFSLKVEYILDSTSNFRSWKIKLLFILDENEIQDYVKKDVTETKDVEEKAKYKKNEAKAKRILIDSVKDHLIPHIVELKTSKAKYDALVGLFERKTTSRRLALRNQLRCMKMANSNFVATYFMKVS